MEEYLTSVQSCKISRKQDHGITQFLRVNWILFCIYFRASCEKIPFTVSIQPHTDQHKLTDKSNFESIFQQKVFYKCIL